ncbi:hypothetical protein K435DRAFT_867260 [Dendrothele bispora CBS 962.96]|uniref:Uncharacterized protein n=1 Tax=Dendrothele bispora (strain CBS 962.96) TaxID=1314807 RepID=A0A4S8LEV1_DENBC|nr:hypothetical protein K435DRAFT_867260 [Dendrothele bispora CBS 962.96]
MPKDLYPSSFSFHTGRAAFASRRAILQPSPDARLPDYDPHPAQQMVYLTELRRLIVEGMMATFSIENLTWIPYRLPVSCHTVEPRSYELTPGYVPPICPHITNPFRSRSDCSMTVREVLDPATGEISFIFRAPHPHCRFIVPIQYSPERSHELSRNQYAAQRGVGNGRESFLHESSENENIASLDAEGPADVDSGESELESELESESEL